MAENKKQHINLRIYDCEIPMVIDAENEALYRKAASLINDKLNAYYNAHRGKKDPKEITYYAMLDIALRFVANKDRNDTLPYDKVLEKLTGEIEEVL